MDIRKQPGSVYRHTAAQEDMALINQLAKTVLDPEQVYTFAVRLCDNEIDRDNEKFTVSALNKLAELFVGKTGIFDHNMKSKDQTARIYHAEVITDTSRKTSDGEDSWITVGVSPDVIEASRQALIDSIEYKLLKDAYN